MKIYVLGSTGMLGNYTATYLKDFFDVIQVNRDILDASKVNKERLHAILKMDIGITTNDVIINCMGTIKPRVDELGDTNAILVNSVFPRILSEVSSLLGAHMIHPTTDCVYSGLKGSYNETDKYDVSDVYGMSKAIGEPNDCTVIRTSIIGEEIGQNRSLVEWVKSSKDKEVFGFTNHYWNGVTCLEFAKICHKIIEDNLFWIGTKHIFSNTLTKQELVQTISDVYGLNISVKPKETDIACDRSLSSIYDTYKHFNIPPLKTQILEMMNFSNTLKND